MPENGETMEKFKRVLSKLEESKNEDLQEALIEEFGENHHHVQSNRQEKIERLKEQLVTRKKVIEELKEEIENKERKIEKLKNIDDFDELEETQDIDASEKQFSSQEEVEELANDFMFLAKEIKDNQYLLQNTLKTFDYYRKMLDSRNTKEKKHFETQMWLKDE